MTADLVSTRLIALVERVRKVRRWLVLFECLQAAAACMAFVVVYALLFAALDHHMHLNVAARIVGLIVLLAGLLYLVVRYVRRIAVHMSCAQAANHIESRFNLDQQLVAAIEYHENAEDYPYSRALADRLVFQAYDATRQLPIERTVPKWQIVALTALVVLGTFTTLGVGVNNYRYFQRYMTRLIVPTSTVAPLPPTDLIPLTQDLVVPADVESPLEVEVRGTVPENITLALNLEGESTEERPVAVGKKADGARVATSMVRFAAGTHRYQFRVNDVSTRWYNVKAVPRPVIASLSAENIPQPGKDLPPFPVEVKDQVLRTLKDSLVRVTVESTVPLRSVEVANLQGGRETPDPKGGATFSFDVPADREGFIGLSLVSAEGMASDALAPIQVLLIVDNEPTFKMTAPDNDYTATQVSSIPVSFEATDDFGFESAELVFEFPNREPLVLPMTLDESKKHGTASTVLELEEYPLEVGDSVLVYGRGRDISTGMRSKGEPTVGEVRFIEIRPSKRLYSQSQSPMPNAGPQGGAPQPDDLPAILGYLRAIVKKTWEMAGKTDYSPADKTKIDGIEQDAAYVLQQLSALRPYAAEKMTAEQLAEYDKIVSLVQRGDESLKGYQPRVAIEDFKEAYRILQKLAQVLRVIFPQGPPEPEKPRPDSIDPMESSHATRFQKEQELWEMQRIARKLAAIKRSQEELRRRFQNLLDPDNPAQNSQSVRDAESWTDKNGYPEEPQGASEKASDNSKVARNSATLEGALPNTPPSSGKSSGGMQMPSGQETQPSAESEARTASFEERMRMLMAQQNSLNQQVSQLKQLMAKMTRDLDTPDPSQASPESSSGQAQGGDGQGAGQASSSSTGSAARRKAEQNLERATEAMRDFERLAQKAIADAAGREDATQHAEQALDTAIREIAEAQRTVAESLEQTEHERAAREMQDKAGQMTEIAEALESGLSPGERAEMMRRLEEAKMLLNQMGTSPQGEGQAQEQNQGQAAGQGQGGGQGTNGTGRLGKPGLGGDSGESASGAEARQLATEFWSKAIDAMKQRGDMPEETPSDADYLKHEKQYFEQTARYGVKTESPKKNAVSTPEKRK